MTTLRFNLIIARLAATILLSATLPALAAPTETPETFVRRVYALYHDKGPGVSTSRPEGTRFFSAALLDAFAKDEEMAHGEVGTIDADPICACQDFGKLRVRRVTVTSAGVDRVKARVEITNFGAPDTVTLTLVQTPAGWRIDDVGSQGMTSVMAVFKLHRAPDPGHASARRQARAEALTEPPAKTVRCDQAVERAERCDVRASE